MNRAAFHNMRLQQQQTLTTRPQTNSGTGPTSPNQLQQFNIASTPKETSFFDDVSTFLAA